jgi:hypothetical protein
LGMRRVGFALAGLGVVVALAMTVVVGTAPNNFPTPVTWGWGRAMPAPEGAISLVLVLVAALLFGLSAWLALRGRRHGASFLAIVVCVASLFVLLGLSMVVWRLHAPVGPGVG